MAELGRAVLPARLAAGKVLRHGVAPLVVGLALAALAAQQSQASRGAGAEADLPLLLWLHVPLLLLSAHAVLRTIEAWPLLGRDRPGAALLARTCADRLAGCASAWLGGVAGAALLCAAAGALFAASLPLLHLAPPAPRAYVAATPVQAYGAIDARCAELQFAARTEADAVRLNPWVAMQPDAAFAPVEVEVEVNGQNVARGLLLSGNGEQRVVALPQPMAVSQVTVRRSSPATLTLLWPSGSLELRRSKPHGWLANLMLAGASYAFAVGVVLAACCALRRVLGWAAMSTFALASLGVVLLSELTPQTAALNTCARGRFLAAHWPVTWPALTAIATLLALAWWQGARRPR